MKKPNALFIVGLLAVVCFAFCSCGGGGGSSYRIPSIPTGGIRGYVYVPIGGERVEGEQVVTFRTAKSVPTGYKPLAGVTVQCGGKSTTSDINGFYSITEIVKGTQTVTLSKSGYQTVTINITITPDATTTVTQEGTTAGGLIPTNSGSIIVSSAPAGAAIYIDGTNTGFTTPRTLSNLKAGNHQIYVTLLGRSNPSTRTITVQNGNAETVDFNFFNVTAGASLIVTSLPSGAAIYFDESYTGLTTPGTLSNITTGYHYINVTLPGYSSVPPTQTINVQNENNEAVDFRFFGVTASVSPMSGITADTFLLKCNFWSLNNTIKKEARCNSTDSWAAVSSGDTKACVYTNLGSYKSGCRANEAATSELNLTVVEDKTLTGFASISTGGNIDCVLMNQGGVKCWGKNREGQLGNGTNLESDTPVDVSGLTMGVTAVSAGTGWCHLGTEDGSFCERNHACALTNIGGIKCWGYNFDGELGDGTKINRSTPVDVSGLSAGVTAISAGGEHTCALLSTGGIKCWGYNSYGELGDGTKIDRSTPVDVSGLSSGAVAISAGGYHTCAILSTGGVKCWGSNFRGELGNGTTTVSFIPTNVSSLSSGVIAITSGLNHTCALLSSGGIKCWGYNFDGELGDGTKTNRSIPVDVSGLSSGVISISSKGVHTCALLSSGGIKCWGYNEYGEIGDGTKINRSTPVDVSGLMTGVTSVFSGGFHTCAILTSGRIKCWGNLWRLGGNDIYNEIPVYIMHQ